MTPRGLWLLALLVLVGVGALVIHQRQAPCGSLLAYRVGSVDPRFGISNDEVLEALRQAENLWEVAVGRKLFTHDPSGPLVVSLVYDERQQVTQTREQLRTSMRETEASHAAVDRSYEQLRTQYESKARHYKDAHAAFQERAQAYNLKVRQANARGGASPAEAASLESERGELEARRRDLEADRMSLEELSGRVRELAEEGNAIAATHNRTAGTFNALYGSARQFHKGEYSGREITVFEFRDTRDLTLLLAHELGHALGMGHVDDPSAVMHAVGAQQVVDPLTLAAADIAALKKVCGRRDPPDAHRLQ